MILIRRLFSPLVLLLSIGFFSPVDLAAKNSSIAVSTSRESYFRYDLVEISVEVMNPPDSAVSVEKMEATFYFNGKLVRTIGEQDHVDLYFEPSSGLWKYSWPIPWNPQLGKYEVLVVAHPKDAQPNLRGNAFFNIDGKIPPRIKPGLCVVASESFHDLGNMSFKGINGTQTNGCSQAVAWAKYMGADALFAMAGLSDGSLRRENKELLVFRNDLLRTSSLLGAESKKVGLEYGAWIDSYVLQMKTYERYGYEPSLGYDFKNAKLTNSYMISLGDKKRLEDLVS